jgi:prophage maintenance system killer protein
MLWRAITQVHPFNDGHKKRTGFIVAAYALELMEASLQPDGAKLTTDPGNGPYGCRRLRNSLSKSLRRSLNSRYLGPGQ